MYDMAVWRGQRNEGKEDDGKEGTKIRKSSINLLNKIFINVSFIIKKKGHTILVACFPYTNVEYNVLIHIIPTSYTQTYWAVRHLYICC